MSAPDPRGVIAGILWTGYSGEEVRAAADQFIAQIAANGLRVVAAPDNDTRSEVEALVADHIHAGDVARSHDTPDLDPDEQASLRRIVRFHDRTAELLAAAYLNSAATRTPDCGNGTAPKETADG